MPSQYNYEGMLARYAEILNDQVSLEDAINMLAVQFGVENVQTFVGVLKARVVLEDARGQEYKSTPQVSPRDNAEGFPVGDIGYD